MDYTQSIGDVTELTCIAEFTKRGYYCCIPYGNSAKYDFVVDVNNNFWRIQCKTSHIAHKSGKKDQNAFSFSAYCQTTNTKKTIRHRYTKNDIDYFATVYNGNVYLIPVEETSTSKTLRLKAPKNNNQNYVKAEDYLIDKILPKRKDFIKSVENSKNNYTKNYCKDCGKLISAKADYCEKCWRKRSRKVLRPNKDELKSLIRKMSFTEIAKKFNVSDKAVSKWCISYNLPHLKSEINKISDNEWDKI